ncbi:MAG TPA: glycosyltransferase family 4 protein [Candidatus Paceibacterota bacterium]
MLKSIFAKPYSKLFIVGDNSGWSTDADAVDLKNFATKLGVPAEIVKRMYLNLPQAVHYTSQFSLLLPIYKDKNRISVDYYHGKPDQQESFKKCFETLKEHENKIIRIRVSNSEMEGLIKSVMTPEKVMRIPLGIDLEVFKPRKVSRSALDIPEEAFVIGSFQKDGVGWDEGLEPKLIKGPDVFLEVISKLKTQIPNLWVLLSGPARGYMKKGLEELMIPYRHKFFQDAADISTLYDMIDLYIITSREEGGPKACLESMAKGVPLVTTAVGQCRDLVKNGENAIVVPVDDVEGLYQGAMKIFTDKELRDTVVKNGFKTAEENGFDAQLPLWREYFRLLID